MIEAQEGLDWGRWFRIADRVEELGFDSLWRSDHLFSVMGRTERSSLECWVSLAALAQRTKRIQFGPLVSPMTFRHPAMLARMAAGVDQLSGGRLVLGVGAGWNEAEHAAFGIALPPLKERMDRLEEGIAVISALWRGGPVDLEGRYYPLHQATAFPRPHQQPNPPLLIGGDGKIRLLGLVARYADEWNSSVRSQTEYREARAALEQHCRAVSRDPESIQRSWMIGVIVGRDPRHLAERLSWHKAFLPSLQEVPVERVRQRLEERSWIIGMPEEVAGRFRTWEQEGVQRIMAQCFDQEDLEGLDLLAQAAQASA